MWNRRCFVLKRRELRSHGVGVAKQLANLRHELAQLRFINSRECRSGWLPIFGSFYLTFIERFQPVAQAFQKKEPSVEVGCFGERIGNCFRLFGNTRTAGDVFREHRNPTANPQGQSAGSVLSNQRLDTEPKHLGQIVVRVVFRMCDELLSNRPALSKRHTLKSSRDIKPHDR